MLMLVLVRCTSASEHSCQEALLHQLVPSSACPQALRLHMTGVACICAGVSLEPGTQQPLYCSHITHNSPWQ